MAKTEGLNFLRMDLHRKKSRSPPTKKEKNIKNINNIKNIKNIKISKISKLLATFVHPKALSASSNLPSQDSQDSSVRFQGKLQSSRWSLLNAVWEKYLKGSTF